MEISRRKFLGVGAAAAASLTLDRTARADILRESSGSALGAAQLAARPVVISSANGIRGVARAY